MLAEKGEGLSGGRDAVFRCCGTANLGSGIPAHVRLDSVHDHGMDP